MGPRVPFAPALLTLSLHITLHIYSISSRLFILLYVICVMVNKAVKKLTIKKNKLDPKLEEYEHEQLDKMLQIFYTEISSRKVGVLQQGDRDTLTSQ